MASVTITWHTMGDEHVCPICKDLEGYSWMFTIGESTPPTALYHPVHGLVCDMATGSEAHKHHRESCRCYLSAEWDLKDILEALTVMLDRLLAAQA